MDVLPAMVSIIDIINYEQELTEMIRKLTENPVWPRPVIVPVPDSDSELAAPYISLNGIWKLAENPTGEYWSNTADVSGWDDVTVPAELLALGYDVRRNREFVYKKKVSIPEEMKDRKIFLKVGMAYEYSKIWVNGHFVRDHGGAFTPFDCDITDYVTPGMDAWITVMCRHRPDALCDWVGTDDSPGYAGLIDNIGILAVPKNHIYRFHYATDLDGNYDNAVLKVTICAELSDTERANVRLSLLDKDGNPVELTPSEVLLDKENSEIEVDIPVKSPLKWDAEHPNLYKLVAEFMVGGKVLQTFSKRVGFRKLERKGNNLYVNGVLTKLRGVARYSQEVLLGKTFTDEQLEKEVKAIKYGNMNFLRSASYPEREKLYEYCDIYGVYVEVCAPVNFQRGAWDSQKDQVKRQSSDIPNYKAEYMNQFSEMIEAYKSHPSIIIWEYANESDWGVNFQTELDYLKHEDPYRLTAGTWDNTRTSLASWHYPEYNEVFNNAAVYDEFVHVATHALDALTRDPNIRNAWGLSLHKGWEVLCPSDGFVGCAIFALGDYIIMRPDGDIFARSFGQWGLLDCWYRERPELWLAKKAYSPVRIKDKEVENPGQGKPLIIPVRNWYNNTNLNELVFSWCTGSEESILEGPDVEPRGSGNLVIPGRNWQDGDIIELTVRDREGMLVDRYELTVGRRNNAISFPEVTGPAPSVKQDDSEITIAGGNYHIVFSKETGLIKKGHYNGSDIITSGPYLNLYGMYYKPSDFSKDRQGEFALKFSGWKLSSIHAEIQGNEAVVHISGTYPGASKKDTWGFEFSYDDIMVDFEVRIDGAGLITTKYTIQNPPVHYLNEVGVAYVLSDEIDRLTWKREALYSWYPENHIGRPEGTAYRYRGYGKDAYRVKPEWEWAYDEADFVYYGGNDKGGHGTNDFRSARENIWYASAVMANSENRVRAESDGKSVTVRAGVAKDEDPDLPEGIKFNMNNLVYYDLGNGSNPNKTGDGYLGNYTYPEIYLEPGYTNCVRMRFANSDR